MTVVNRGNGFLTGVAADTKPTTYPTGTRFFETDTGSEFYYNGASWTAMAGGGGGITASSADTLTNKNIDALTNTMPNVIQSPLVKKWGAWQGQAQLKGFDGMWQLADVTAITVGSATNTIVRDSTGIRTRFTTGTTINSMSGARISASLLTERDLNPETHFKVNLGQTTDTRVVFGFTSGGAPTSAIEPLPSNTGVVFIYDSSVDANWHIRQNQGTATSADVVTNVAAAGTTARIFKLRADNANTKFQYSYNLGAWTDIPTTQIPTASTTMGWIWYIDNLTTTSKTFDIYGAYHVQDG